MCHQIQKQTSAWKENHLEIVKLLKIAAAKPESTSENERRFSVVDRIVTKKRENLSDSHVEDLTKISFESRREFGEELHKVVKYKSQITGKLKKDFKIAEKE